jgi:hypothetical protein
MWMWIGLNWPKNGKLKLFTKTGDTLPCSTKAGELQLCHAVSGHHCIKVSHVFRLHFHLTIFFFSDVEEKNVSCADWSSKMWQSHLVPQLELMPCAADPCLFRQGGEHTNKRTYRVVCDIHHNRVCFLFVFCFPVMSEDTMFLVAVSQQEDTSFTVCYTWSMFI